MNPREPSTTYHWEAEQEDFLVLAGEAILLTQDSALAYERFEPGWLMRYPKDLLPD